ncbi:4Fe-4S dicluster domain-containing protein [Nitrospirota bacterium]
MPTGVYICRCGTNIADKINEDRILLKIGGRRDVGYVTPVDLLCSEEGKAFLEKDLKDKNPDQVVYAACSPRDHESTFRRVMKKAGLNPNMMQMTNIREQVAWVVNDQERATDKALAYVNAAVERVALHEPFADEEVEACGDALVIGAGPAGLKAALSIAQSGRKVILIERGPAIGGMPVLFEEIFPDMECGPCMLEPLLDEVLHGDYAENIELLTLSQVHEVLGFYGNFEVSIKQQPRYVNLDTCIGCGECIEPCPVQVKNEFNVGLDVNNAIAFPFAGALPSAPLIDNSKCMRFKGEVCTMCQESCPIEGTIDYTEEEIIHQRKVGAILIAIGSDLYSCDNIPNLGYGDALGVYTSLEFERLLSANGPTGGQIRVLEGCAPSTIALVHCAGSLDRNHKEYCSGICCQSAFKFNHMIEKQLPGTRIYHLYKEIVMPGKGEFRLQREARDNPNAEFIRYEDIRDIQVQSAGEKDNIRVDFKDITGTEGSFGADMVVLCMAMVPGTGASVLSRKLGVSLDDTGYFEELHGRLDSVQSKIKGIYLAGSCKAPMDIQRAMDQGMASAGYILSGLVEGKKLKVTPVAAEVVADRCGACRTCMDVCPYKAVSLDSDTGKAYVNALLCTGCGTCVAACPAGAIKGHNFTSEEILAEIRGVLL